MAYTLHKVSSQYSLSYIQGYCIEQTDLSNVANIEVQMEDNLKVLRCKSSTDANKLAGSIHSTYSGNPDAQIIIRVIGAGSLNQAVKAAIISNKFFAKKGLVVVLQPSFQDTSESMTAIELKVLLEKR